MPPPTSSTGCCASACAPATRTLADTTLQGLRHGSAATHPPALRRGTLDRPRGVDPGRDQRQRGPRRRRRAHAHAAGGEAEHVAPLPAAGRLLSRFATATVAGLRARDAALVRPAAGLRRPLARRALGEHDARRSTPATSSRCTRSRPTSARIGDIVTFDNHGKLTSHRARVDRARRHDDALHDAGRRQHRPGALEGARRTGASAGCMYRVPKLGFVVVKVQSPDRPLRPDHPPGAAARRSRCCAGSGAASRAPEASMSRRASGLRPAALLRRAAGMLCGASGSVWGAFKSTTRQRRQLDRRRARLGGVRWSRCSTPAHRCAATVVAHRDRDRRRRHGRPR